MPSKKKQTKRHKSKAAKQANKRPGAARAGVEVVVAERPVGGGLGKSKGRRRKTEPAAGVDRSRTARKRNEEPPPAPEIPKYLTDPSVPELVKAQYAVLDARGLDANAVSRVHLPGAMAILDETITGLMKSQEGRDKRAGLSALRLIADGDLKRLALETELRKTAIEAHMAGFVAELQAKLHLEDSEGVSEDLLGQIEPLMQEIAERAAERIVADR